MSPNTPLYNADCEPVVHVVVLGVGHALVMASEYPVFLSSSASALVVLYELHVAGEISSGLSVCSDT